MSCWTNGSRTRCSYSTCWLYLGHPGRIGVTAASPNASVISQSLTQNCPWIFWHVALSIKVAPWNQEVRPIGECWQYRWQKNGKFVGANHEGGWCQYNHVFFELYLLAGSQETQHESQLGGGDWPPNRMPGQIPRGLTSEWFFCNVPYIYMNNKVWRERCFILLEKRGFDFFQTQALWHFIMFLFTCIMMLSVLKTFARAAFHRCLWLSWDSFLPEGGLLEPQFLFILGFMKSNPQRMRADLKRLEIQRFLCKRILPCPFCLTWAVEGLLGLRSCCFKIWN